MALESIPPSARLRISSRARLQNDRVTGKPVLLYPEGALLLNPTAHAIALLCNGNGTLESIVLELTQKYQGSSTEISGQVTNFLNRLRAKKLLDLI